MQQSYRHVHRFIFLLTQYELSKKAISFLESLFEIINFKLIYLNLQKRYENARRLHFERKSENATLSF